MNNTIHVFTNLRAEDLRLQAQYDLDHDVKSMNKFLESCITVTEFGSSALLPRRYSHFTEHWKDRFESEGDAKECEVHFRKIARQNPNMMNPYFGIANIVGTSFIKNIVIQSKSVANQPYVAQGPSNYDDVEEASVSGDEGPSMQYGGVGGMSQGLSTSFENTLETIEEEPPKAAPRRGGRRKKTVDDDANALSF